MIILNRAGLVTLALLTAGLIWSTNASAAAPGIAEEAVFKTPRRPDIPRKCVPKKPCPRGSGAVGR